MSYRFYLVGYMASGKSFLGRTVSGMMGIPFLDLDIAIEELAGMPIPRIFAEQGEEAFRVLESEALVRTAEMESVIVATGGGTPCFGGNMEWMNDNGITIFLDASPEIIADRISRSNRVRPLLEGIPAEDLSAFIKDHLAGRLPFYRRAHFNLQVAPGREENIQHLLELVRRISLPDDQAGDP